MSEQADISGGPISLVIPGKPEYISLARLLAGVVGVRELLDEEVIADLKLAISEACTSFLWGPEGDPLADRTAGSEKPSSLQVDFTIAPDAW